MTAEAASGPGAREPAAAGTVGGKALQLGRLAAAGLPVPPFAAISAEELGELHRAVEATGVGESARDPGSLAAAASRACQAAAEALDTAARTAIAAALASLGSPARVAVRSSVSGEDSEESSFAGQMLSVLHVAAGDVPARVIDVAASAWGARALGYRSARGLPLAGIRTGVVLQRMVEARTSGVLFTVDPLTGSPGSALVAAGLGLGEGVVADAVECDSYRLDLRAARVVERNVVPKGHAVLPDDTALHGTRRAEVDGAARLAPALADAELALLMGLARGAQAALGRDALDIEWALDGEGKAWLLQARPVTAPGSPPPIAAEESSVFDNSNIVESYPGLTLPLTFTFARRAYEEIFRQAARRLGVPESTLRDCRHVHANLVALVDGRVYYNILHFYRIMTLVPGFEGMLPAWERALGLPPQPRPSGGGPGPLARRFLQARVASRLLEELLGLDRAVARLKTTLDRQHAAFRRRDLSRLSAHELLLEHERLSTEVMPPFALTVINDLFCQQLFDLVARLAARWQLGDPMELRNALASGETGMDSVAPARSLAALAELVAASPLLSDALASPRPMEALARGEAAGFRRALEEHVAAHGDRMPEELKLETRTFAEDPALLLACIRAAAAAGTTVAALDRRERAPRAAAEEKVARRLAGHPLRRMLFAVVLRRARATLRHREDLRLRRARAFGIVRRQFSEIGARLFHSGALHDPRDVFWLGVDEVAGAVRGHALDVELPAVVARRKAAYARHVTLSPPGRITIAGPAAGRVPPDAATIPPAAERPSLLRGTGCAAGTARGIARVVRSPAPGIDSAGAVLVAPMTDPGWVFLMLSAAGLVVERGSILSHTAIIGRELGIPTVVGVPGATELIPDGCEIEIDGASGLVRIGAAPGDDGAPSPPFLGVSPRGE